MLALVVNAVRGRCGGVPALSPLARPSPASPNGEAVNWSVNHHFTNLPTFLTKRSQSATNSGSSGGLPVVMRVTWGSSRG